MYAKVLALVILFCITSNIFTVLGDFNKQQKQVHIPPCKACKIFVDSFKKGMENTEKGQFEGGDAAWEEEKLKPYRSSELRLTEIQEKLCHELQEGKEQCFSQMEKYDPEIEEWWFNKREANPDLFTYLCINIFKVCCADDHFGLECSPCPGFPGNVCNGNGKCRGSGSRKGNGTCNCHSGYTGDMCDKCALSYFASYKDDKKVLCSKCHDACDGPCFKAGTGGCEKCKSGWLFEEAKGCVDINECATQPPVCSPLHFCVNNDGSYTCLKCDKACLGCTGDGPDMCVRCASGYTMQNHLCIDTSQESRLNYVWYTRYITYIGLCIATCIIFQKNVPLAAIIGIAVATYIYASEYMISTPPQPDTDALKNELNKMFN